MVNMFAQKSINAAPSNLVLDLRPDGATGSVYAKCGKLTISAVKDGGADAVVLVRAIRVDDGQSVPAAIDLSTTSDYQQLGTAAGQLQQMTIGTSFAQGYNYDVYRNNTFSHVMITIVAQARVQVIGE